jgi:hypothetical protein
LQPFKAEVNYLKEREAEITVQLNAKHSMDSANDFTQRNLINDGSAIVNKISMLEQEIIDVKNIYRIPV